MYLFIDAGNSFVKWAFCAAGAPARDTGVDWHVSGRLSQAEIGSLAGALLRDKPDTPIRKAVFSNVAGPGCAEEIEKALSFLQDGHLQVERFASRRELAGVTNCYEDASRLGCDRFASLIGAKRLFPGRPLVVVTAGTATTVDALSPDGAFTGGMIVPGLKLMAASLHANTAQLPAVGGFADIPDFANDTQQAILCGCVNAQAGAIEHAVSRHAEIYGETLCVLSGGAAPFISPKLGIDHVPVDNLVLVGLYSSCMD